MSDGPVTEDGKADYDAATARQFQRREPDPCAAQWEPGEFNECSTCRACHVTSTFGGMRVIADPNLPHGHHGVVVDDRSAACDELITKRAADWGQELLDHEQSIRQRIAADIEAFAAGLDGSAGIRSRILDPSLRAAALTCASIARSGL